MPPLTYAENLVGGWVAAGGIASIAAPSASTELDTMVDLSSFIRQNGGIQWPNGRGTVPTDTIDRKRLTTYPGSESGVLEVTFLVKNRAGATTARDLFAGGEVEGFLVFGFEGSNDTAADDVEVYHVVGDKPTRNNPGPDENQMITVRFHIQDANEEAVVAA